MKYIFYHLRYLMFLEALLFVMSAVIPKPEENRSKKHLPASRYLHIPLRQVLAQAFGVPVVILRARSVGDYAH